MMRKPRALVPTFDVVGLGVNALDLIAVIDGMPPPDSKVPFHDLDIQGGGMTATAMVACARLGLRARYIGKVGTDLWSRMAMRIVLAAWMAAAIIFRRIN